MKIYNNHNTRINRMYMKGHTLIIHPKQTIDVPSDIYEDEIEAIIKAFKDLRLIKDNVDLGIYDLDKNNQIDKADDADRLQGRIVDDTKATTSNLWTADKISDEVAELDRRLDQIEDGVGDLLDEIDGGTF